MLPMLNWCSWLVLLPKMCRRRSVAPLLPNSPEALAAYPALLIMDDPLSRLVPQIVQFLSLSEFVLQPHASQVHRCATEPDADDAPTPAGGDADDSSALLEAMSIFRGIQGARFYLESILCLFVMSM